MRSVIIWLGIVSAKDRNYTSSLLKLVASEQDDSIPTVAPQP
jgi:hypothetical protein